MTVAAEPKRAKEYAPHATAADAVFRRVSQIAALSERSVATLGPLLEIVSAGESLPRTGDGLAPRIVVSGWAFRFITLPDGRRQILGFVLPGDSVGAICPERPLNRAQAQALTHVRMADAKQLFAFSEGVARALAAEEEELLLNHVVRLGPLTAYERMVHLLLELHARLSRVGLVENGSFDFPFTQETLADTLGLSIVHVNRMLQRLRLEQLIEVGRSRITLLDLERMRDVCEFKLNGLNA